MNIIKRNGLLQRFSRSKLIDFLAGLSCGLSCNVRISSPDDLVLQQIEQGIRDEISIPDLQTFVAETVASFATHHPDYAILAGRIEVTTLHAETNAKFSSVVTSLYSYKSKAGVRAPLVSDDIYNTVQTHCDVLDGAIVHERDYDFDYFGVKTLMKSYLLRGDDGVIRERPQHMFMRVALGIHGDDIEKVLETYHLLSRRFFIHATPTLHNAGTKRPQMSSCFLTCIKADSISGIYDTLKDCAIISKHGGGIGMTVSNIRAAGSYVGSVNGVSGGIVPMLRVFNNSARYVDQGGGKRKGSIAVYIEPWHSDVFSFLCLKKNHGNEMERARDLFYALWVPDLFMERVQADEDWTLFCPSECKGLERCWGGDFKYLYEQYENEGRGRSTVKARDLWFAIIDSQVETGTPYMLYKDHCNRKSNQNHLGTIQCSNLCAEIVQYTSPDEIAVCNLASLSLLRFIADQGFDFELLRQVTKVMVRNLDRLIDLNYYPLDEARVSNTRHRPIGVGVQGLADVFQILRLPFESTQARELNRAIFETVYFGACEASMELAAEHGTYESYEESPMSKGQLQFDLWGVKPNLWDWSSLRRKIASHGLRNSLLVAVMPTASTAQILGNSEGIDPVMSNMYIRRVNAGEYMVINKHLVRALSDAGLWSDRMRSMIIASKGSIQTIESIPASVRSVFRTAWEIPQRAVLDMAADRGAFICQSQSLNIHMEEPTVSKLTSLHFHAWKIGLKTGMYYLRTRPKADAIQFTVDRKILAGSHEEEYTENGKTSACLLSDSRSMCDLCGA